MCWSLILQGFKIHIRHNQGHDNVVADALSRAQNTFCYCPFKKIIVGELYAFILIFMSQLSLVVLLQLDIR